MVDAQRIGDNVPAVAEEHAQQEQADQRCGAHPARPRVRRALVQQALPALAEPLQRLAHRIVAGRRRTGAGVLFRHHGSSRAEREPSWFGAGGNWFWAGGGTLRSNDAAVVLWVFFGDGWRSTSLSGNKRLIIIYLWIT